MNRIWVGRFKRIVVKIGSSVILQKSGEVNFECLESLAKEMAEIRKTREVMIVSSGAIGIGKTILGIRKIRDLAEKQALAAVGQARLIQIYENLFFKFGIKVGQVLLTREDFQYRHRYLKARTTLLRLLNYGVIPVINENDTIAVEEIKFGDNDTLSALVASKMDADLLIMLSNVEGIYDKQGRIIHEIVDIGKISTKTIPASAFGVGGIETKKEAAEIMRASGIPMVIAKGDTPDIILQLVDKGEWDRKPGTWFIPYMKMRFRKRWIAFGAEIKGNIVIDDGAVKVLKEGGKSLLPSGIKEVGGSFKSGDVVCIKTLSGREIGRGMVNYSADEIRKIAGRKTGEVASILGQKGYDEVIHCDNLAIFKWR